MTVRIATAVGIAFVLFAIYSWWTASTVDGFALMSQHYETAQTFAPPVEASKTRVISPGGPNAPNQRPPSNTTVIMPEEEPYDPMEQSHESSAIPERLRHPERMFGPGLEHTDTETAVAAGTASMSHDATMNAYQTFGPEFAQNGGLFMEGIAANDTTLPTSYSSV
jgi:hypothetical protein